MITQAQIEAAAKAIWLNNHPMLDGRWEDYIKDGEAALTAAAEVDDTEWTCADCGHKQRGHRFHCEKCGHNFGTVAAAEVGERNQIIERCAQVAKQYAKKHFATNPEGLAAAIMALKDS